MLRGVRRIGCRLAFVWMLLVCPAWASNVTSGATPGQLTIADAPSYALSSSFTYLEDPSGRLELTDILLPAAQARFGPIAAAGATSNFGVSRSAFWLRIDLRAQTSAPRQWLLEIAYPSLDSIDLYTPRDGHVSDTPPGAQRAARPESHVLQRGGDLLPFAQRPMPHRNHVFPVTLQPGSSNTIYLRVASQGAIAAPAKLWQPAAFGQKDQGEYSLLSLYFGLLIGLLLYNLLLYFAIRDRSYLFYVLFVAGMGLTQAALSGIGTQFLWADWLWWTTYSAPISMATSSCFAILFARDFLSTASTAPVLNRLILAMAGFCMLTVLAAIGVSYEVAGWMVTVSAVIAPPLLVAAGVLSVRRKHPGAKYFLIAWAALLLGVVILGLHNNGLVPSNPFTANALLIGSAIEMVLLSFALADRINTVRAESEEARAASRVERAKVDALQLSQQRYQTVIDHVGEGMMVLQGGRVIFANVCAAEIFGTTNASLMEAGFLDQIQVEDRALFQRRVADRLAGRDLPPRYELRIRRPDGTPVWLEMGDTNVSWDGHTRVLVFFSDLTDRKRAEEDTRVALHQQQELNRLRSRFVAMSSHEFRTPLAGILSSQELLQHYGTRLSESEKDELHHSVIQAVKRMTHLMDQVLIVGKAEAHMLEFRPEQLDLAALCQRLVEEARLQQPDAACTVVTEFADCGTGRYDEKLLRHIFGNLLSNAIKYSPEGGVVRFSVRREQGQLVLEVADQGIGIPAEDIPHLFESFQRAGNVGAIHGTGLGLAIVKSAVTQHGGTIDVISTVGQGSCFTVRL